MAVYYYGSGSIRKPDRPAGRSMATTTHHKYNFFVSYRRGEPDETFARDILKRLEAAGLKGAMDKRDFGANAPFLEEMERCVKESSFTLCLLSPRYLDSGNCREEAIICKVLDMAERKRRLIPLVIAPAETPAWLYDITGIDFTEKKPLVPPMEKLMNTLGIMSGAPRTEMPSTPIHNLPEPVRHFTGRVEVLEKIEKALGANSGIAGLTQVRGISGLGGIGKTQTALAFAWRHLGKPYNHVFWVRADTESEIVGAFMEIARKLDLPQKDARETDVVVEAVRAWFEQNENWLLVLDNVEWDGQEMVGKHVPSRGKGHVLVTSRAHALDALDIQKPIPLDKMEPDEARDFLINRTANLEADATPVNAVAKELGYLPLALEQAAAYIVEKECSFADYLKGFKTRRAEYLRFKPKGTDYPDTAATTWLMNFEQVGRESKPARGLLYFCAFLDPDRIPIEIIRDSAAELGPELSAALANAKEDPVALHDVLEPLTRYSLIRYDRDDDSLSIHRLVQDVVRAGMNEEDQRAWAERAVLAVNATFPYIGFENWPRCERLLPHVPLAANYIERYGLESSQASRLLNQAANYLYMRARYAEAEPLTRRALAIDEAAYGPEHPDVARDLSNLALLLQATNRLVEAEPLMRRALAIAEASYGPDHPAVATALNNLAQLLQDTNRLGEAEPLMRRALAIAEAAYGPVHPDVAKDLNNLALLLQDTNRLDEAEPLMRRALAIDEAAYGPEHPKVSIGLNNLAQLLQATNRLDEAEPLMRRALAITEASYSPEHPKVAIRLNNLAQLLQATNRLAEAEPLVRGAASILRKFREDTGHRNPNMYPLARNYLRLLREMGLPKKKALAKVQETSGLSLDQIEEALAE